MLFLWSKSGKIGSKIIRWGLDEPSSHFALAFFEENGPSAPLIESRLAEGIQLNWIGDFLDKSEIVHALRASFSTHMKQENLFHHMSKNLRGRKYDTWGVGYWIYVGAMRKFFGKQVPKNNKWNRTDMDFCVEVLDAMDAYLEGELGVDFDELNMAMTSPEMAYEMLKDNQHLEDVTSWFV